MITLAILSFLALPVSASAPAFEAQVKLEIAKKSYLEGAAFPVHLEITASKDGGSLPAWALSGAAFEVDGKALGERANGKFDLAPGQKLVTDIDLGPLLAKAKIDAGKPFKLALAGQVGDAPATQVSAVAAAENGLKFTDMEAAELAKFHVMLQTNQGTMELEFWPDVAPNCVRNFLDLCYTHFYDGLTFHRVMPGFMIQGGDPKGDGTGNGPRTLKDEFSNKKHEAGVLSMASSGPNTASSQFFIMHKPAPHLDGKYSAFGKLVTGLDVLEKIVNAPGKPIPGAGGNRPNEPQKIEKATVVRIAK